MKEKRSHMDKQKTLVGTVVSDKMQKTIVVRIMHKSKHPTYGRTIKRYNKFKVHDEKNQAKMGDTVKITATRPISKEKDFKLVEVVRKAALPQELNEVA
jgi:small subunit ribosomal protein S17